MALFTSLVRQLASLRHLHSSHLRRMVSPLVVTAGALALGCGDDGGANPEPSPQSGPSDSLSALEEKLSNCALVQMTEDPSASTCLQGTYSGKTLSGGDCSLTIGEAGAYAFTSATLSVDSSPKGNSLFLFGHSSFGNFGQLVWKVSDPIDTEAWYELDFTARYGQGASTADRKIQIEVQKNGSESMSAVSCSVGY